MTDLSTSWRENAELGTVLLEAMTYTARLFCENLAPLLKELKSGRSPRQLSLEVRLQKPQELLDGGLESLTELQSLIRQQLASPAAPQKYSELLQSFQRETLLWEHFFSLGSSLVQRIERLRDQSGWNATSYFPLGELWQELQQTLQQN